MEQGAASHFGSGKPFRDVGRIAGLDLAPRRRPVAGAVGGVESLGDDAFVAGGDGRGEEGAAGANDTISQGQLRDGESRA